MLASAQDDESKTKTARTVTLQKQAITGGSILGLQRSHLLRRHQTVVSEEEDGKVVSAAKTEQKEDWGNDCSL